MLWRNNDLVFMKKISEFIDITLRGRESYFPSDNLHSCEKAMGPRMTLMMEGGKGRVRISSHSTFKFYFTNNN